MTPDVRKRVLEAHAVTMSSGAGRPLVLLHGFGTNQMVWRGLMDRLGGAGRFITLDHMGCGRSNVADYDPARYQTLDDYARDLVDVLDALNVSDAVIVGHSASGMIGMLAAEASSRVSAVFAIGSSARYMDDVGYRGGFAREEIDGLLALLQTDFQAWVRSIAPLAMDNPDRPELSRDLIYTFSQSNPEYMRDFARAIFYSDYRERLANFTKPTLVVQSASDALVPQEAAEYLAAHVPGAEFRQLAARGHFPQLSAPAELAGVLREFLATLP